MRRRLEQLATLAAVIVLVSAAVATVTSFVSHRLALAAAVVALAAMLIGGSLDWLARAKYPRAS